MNTPEFVKRDGIIADNEYVEWLHELKQRYQQSQAKAAVRVNQSLLEFYWSLGHDIVALKAESQWGSGVLQQLSIDLQQMFPRQKGFSYRNIRYIKQWYLFYYQEYLRLRQVDAELPDTIWQQVAAKMENTKWQQAAANFSMPSNFALVPWFHHVHIVSKSNSLKEALFYVNQTIANNWSRSQLEREKKQDGN